jgi:hypothetical protein
MGIWKSHREPRREELLDEIEQMLTKGEISEDEAIQLQEKADDFPE